MSGNSSSQLLGLMEVAFHVPLLADCLREEVEDKDEILRQGQAEIERARRLQ